MKYNYDPHDILDYFEKIVAVPSPVSYYVQMNPVIEQLAAQLGLQVTFDHKQTAYIALEGQDNSKTVLVGAHLDTLGLVVRCIDADGMIRVRQLGGVNYASLEGETVTVHTRDGRSYTGLMACQSHSVHVFDDARTVERTENTMMVILDQPVKSKADVNALGIRHGDIISVDPRCQVTENGYLKSRFIDDKASVACVFAALKYMKDNGVLIMHHADSYCEPIVEDMVELGIFESLQLKRQVLLSASEAAEMIVRVDEIIQSAPRQRVPDEGRH